MDVIRNIINDTSVNKILSQIDDIDEPNSVPELEVRIGKYNTKTKSFVPSLEKYDFDKIMNTSDLFYSNKQGKIDENTEKTIVTFNTNKSSNSIRTIMHYDSKGKRSKIEYNKKVKIDNYTNRDIGVRIALAYEVMIDKINSSDMQKIKANTFRYKNRITRISKDRLWKFDFTMVNSITNSDINIIKEWKTNALNGNIKPDSYELEIEYINDNGFSDTSKIHNSLLLQLVNIMQIIKPDILVSNIKINKNEIYNDFSNILHLKIHGHINFNNIVSKVVTLEKKHISRIENELYSVTGKADGYRSLLYLSNNVAILIDGKNNFTIVSDNSKPSSSNDINNGPDKILIDGEFIDESNTFLCIDILINNSKNVTTNSLLERHDLLQKVLKEHSKRKGLKINIKMKPFEYTTKSGKDIYKLTKKVYSDKYSYKLDGIIFTPIDEMYYSKYIYKWKPMEELSIDFLVKRSEDTDESDKNNKYLLYVGLSRNLYNKLHKNIMLLPDNYSEIFSNINYKFDNNKTNYIPVLFNPENNTKTYVYEISKKDILKIITEINKKYNIILDDLDDTVCEFWYNKGKWEFLKYRDDKTTTYKRSYANFGNNWDTAVSVWKSITDPITLNMITGKEEITEPVAYFNVEQTKLIIGLKKFHNYVKGSLYEHYLSDQNEWVLELAGGRYNDLYRWSKNGIDNVVVVDLDSDALKQGELREKEMRNDPKNKFNVPNIYPIKADISDNNLTEIINDGLVNMDAFNGVSNIHNKFDTIICHFAIHYILSGSDNLNNFYNAINYMLKPGGHLILSSLNGKKVNDLFKKNKVEMGNILKLSKDYNNQEIDVFNLMKLYKTNKLSETGQAINVHVESLGEGYYTEYLVNYTYLKKIFTKKKEFTLIEHTEFKSYLPDFLETSHGKKFLLSKSEKIYSSLHDFIVFEKN